MRHDPETIPIKIYIFLIKLYPSLSGINIHGSIKKPYCPLEMYLNFGTRRSHIRPNQMNMGSSELTHTHPKHETRETVIVKTESTVHKG
jgi:hypothetical protein